MDRCEIAAPTVFCTAFSEYALRAFKANSIDYLLKPVTQARLTAALAKTERLQDLNVPPEAWRCPKARQAGQLYRERFLVEAQRQLEVVSISEVVAAAAWYKACRPILATGDDRMVDEPLKDVHATLDPALFFQISR